MDGLDYQNMTYTTVTIVTWQVKSFAIEIIKSKVVHAWFPALIYSSVLLLLASNYRD